MQARHRDAKATSFALRAAPSLDIRCGTSRSSGSAVAGSGKHRGRRGADGGSSGGGGGGGSGGGSSLRFISVPVSSGPVSRVYRVHFPSRKSPSRGTSTKIRDGG